jgi:hypothetical protein
MQIYSKKSCSWICLKTNFQQIYKGSAKEFKLGVNHMDYHQCNFIHEAEEKVIDAFGCLSSKNVKIQFGLSFIAMNITKRRKKMGFGHFVKCIYCLS